MRSLIVISCLVLSSLAFSSKAELIKQDRIGDTQVYVRPNNTATVSINVKNGLNINNEIIWLVLKFNSIDAAINTLNLIKDPNLNFIRIYFKDSTVEEVKTQESNTHFLSDSGSELEISFRPNTNLSIHR